MEDGFYWYVDDREHAGEWEIVRVAHTDPPPLYRSQGIHPEQVVWVFEADNPSRIEDFSGRFVGPIEPPPGSEDLMEPEDTFPPIKDETHVERAQRLIDALVPRFRNRDQAVDNLYFVTPNATEAIRMASIAAALYFLGVTEQAEKIKELETTIDVLYDTLKYDE